MKYHSYGDWKFKFKEGLLCPCLVIFEISAWKKGIL